MIVIDTVLLLLLLLLLLFHNIDICNSLQIYILEESPPGTSLGRAIPQNENGSSFRFTQESNLFSINSTTSEIIALIRLDRDGYAYADTMNVSISWIPSSPLDTDAITHIVINIIDINDNSPTFNRNSETVVFTENSRIGLTKRITAASDIDKGVNAAISYTLEKQAIETSTVIPFSINVTAFHTVYLVVTEILDYETKQNYYLKLVATDGGIPQRSSELLLFIQILDVNDNRPNFLLPFYRFTVPENAPVNSVVGTVLAHDNDSVGIIIYKLAPPSALLPFRIDNVTGVISVSGVLDYETTTLYHLHAVARNNIPVLLSTSNITNTSIEVIITDINDNKPMLRYRGVAGSLIQISQLEEVSCPPLSQLNCDYVKSSNANRNSDCYISVDSVIDNDTGPGGDVIWATIMGSGAEYFSVQICTSLFLMTEKAVFLFNTKPIDRESFAQLSLALTLYDGGSPQLTSDWMISVNIQDINDNRPLFTLITNGISITENIAINTSILNVTATDRDVGVNAAILYSIVQYYPASAASIFSIDQLTGAISTLASIDREAHPLVITLTVQASSLALYTHTNISVVITDVNDNRPVFSEVYGYNITINESTPTNTVITTVTAIDVDTGYAGTVRYSISPTGVLSVNATTGEISLFAPVDYETADSYVFTVTAVDLSVPSLSGRAQIRLYITDDNDNSPVFMASSLLGSVTENSPSNTTVAVIQATDIDSGANKLINYTLLNSTDLFNINTMTGVITTTNISIDREYIPILHVGILATDNGIPNPLTTTATAIIDVLDVNDNTPDINYDVIISNILYTETTPILLADSLVTDKDLNTLPCENTSFASINPNLYLQSINNICNLYSLTTEEFNNNNINLTISDGMHYNSSIISISSRLFTNNISNYSISIRISSMTPQEFLANHYQTFLTLIPSFQSMPVRIHIWSLTPLLGNLDILLSAQITPGIWINPITLAQILPAYISNIPENTITVLSYRNSACNTNNTCSSNGRCVDQIVITGVTFHPEYMVAMDGNMLFRSLDHTVESMCICDTGFEGATCSALINNCSSNPCFNQGFCHNMFPADYFCSCTNQYTGKDCETQLTPCSSNPCLNNGICSISNNNNNNNNNNDYICTCIAGYGGRSCEQYIGFCGTNPCLNGGNCTNSNNTHICDCKPGYIGEFCESTLFCFQTVSHLQFPQDLLLNLDTVSKLIISFQLKTTVQSGQLIYMQDSTNNFLLLELINSSMHYLARTDGLTFVEVYLTTNVTDGMWHHVVLTAYIGQEGNIADLTIDGISKLGKGPRDLDPVGLARQSALSATISLSGLYIPLTLGGVSNYSSDVARSPYAQLSYPSAIDAYRQYLQLNNSILDYVGALRNFSINDQLITLDSASYNNKVYSGVVDCVVERACGQPSSCSGRGTCYDMYTDHLCVCQGAYTGDNCQYELIPVTVDSAGVIQFSLSYLFLQYAYKPTSDWQIIERILSTEVNLGLRHLDITDNAQLRYYGRHIVTPHSIEIALRTRSSNGVVMTVIDTTQYSVLEIKNDRLRFRIGSVLVPSLTNYDITLSSVDISNGSSFRINITLTDTELTLLVMTIYGHDIYTTDNTNSVVLFDSRSRDSTVITIGGYTHVLFNRLTPGASGIAGCIDNVSVSDISVPLHQPLYSFYGISSVITGGVTPGCNQTGVCQLDSCPRFATCVPEWAGVSCDCSVGYIYSGQECVEINDCTTTSCLNGGTCVNRLDGFTCNCNSFYFGELCQHVNMLVLIIVLVGAVFVSVVICVVVIIVGFFLHSRKRKHHKVPHYHSTHHSGPTRYTNAKPDSPPPTYTFSRKTASHPDYQKRISFSMPKFIRSGSFRSQKSNGPLSPEFVNTPVPLNRSHSNRRSGLTPATLPSDDHNNHNHHHNHNYSSTPHSNTYQPHTARQTSYPRQPSYAHLNSEPSVFRFDVPPATIPQRTSVSINSVLPGDNHHRHNNNISPPLINTLPGGPTPVSISSENSGRRLLRSFYIS